MRAFLYKDKHGIEHSKTHFRRECKICIETQCGCMLPFRRLSKFTRLWMRIDRERL